MRAVLVAIGLALAATPPASAQATQQRQILLVIDHPIRLRGSVHGSELVNFRFDATEGTQLSIAMASDNPSAHFNFYGPIGTAGMPDEAIFTGSTSGREFVGRIPQSAAYVVRVHLMRATARRNEEAYYRLDMRLTSIAKPSTPSDGDLTGAVPSGPQEWRVIGIGAGDALNIRAGPSASMAIVGRVGDGAILQQSWLSHDRQVALVQCDLSGWKSRAGHLAGSWPETSRRSMHDLTQLSSAPAPQTRRADCPCRRRHSHRQPSGAAHSQPSLLPFTHVRSSCPNSVAFGNGEDVARRFLDASTIRSATTPIAGASTCRSEDEDGRRAASGHEVCSGMKKHSQPDQIFG